MNTLSLRSRIPKIITHIFFWGFNVPLAFTVLNWVAIFGTQWFSENQFSSLKQLTGFIPTDILITLAIFFAMPIASIIGAVATKAYRNPAKLRQILLGIELPIMAFTLGRLIFLKTLTPVNILLLSAAAISIAAYTIHIFKKPFRKKFILAIHLMAVQAAVVIGVYASLLMFFFLPIVLALIFQAVSSFFEYGFINVNYYESFWQILTGLIAMGAFSLLFFALIGSPFIGLFMYWRAANKLNSSLQKRSSTLFSRVSRWGFSLLYSFAIIFLAYQGSMVWFYSEMGLYQSATTFEERSRIATTILKREKFVGDRLVDTYLAQYRYLTDSQMTVLQQAYQDQLKLEQPIAKRLQNWFTLAAFPFVYNGKFEEDVKKAGEYYQDIFDEPIQLAESKKVSKILTTSFNFSTDQMKSSILDRKDKDVHLVKKIVSAQPDPTGQFATVTIEEEYENTTNSEQEVFYIFSLPQDSVMTDLQLGADLELGKEQLELAQTSQPTPTPVASAQSDSPAPTPLVIPQPIEHKDQGEIAAKGAANQTFEDQYRQRLDPAILEQVGPVQYKLRVYPIPVKEEILTTWQRASLQEPVRNQKVRYSYVTALDYSGNAALPKVSETRNIYSDSKTTLSYAGSSDQTNTLTATSQNIAVVTRTSQECGSLATKLLNGSHLTLYIPHAVNPWIADENITFDCQNQFAGAEEKLNNKRIAILADSSHSMGITDWKSYLDKELPLDDLLTANIVDLYYFNDLVSQPVSLNQQRNNPKAWNQIAFGKTDRLHVLSEVEGKYDLVLMFTDGSEADEPGRTDFVPSIAQPIYMINKDGTVPKLTDNLTYYLQANESRIVSSGREALQNFVVSQAVKQNVPNTFVLVGESGTWISSPAVNAQTVMTLSARSMTPGEPIAKVALHRQIESEIRSAASDLNQLTVLDSLNRTAQKSGIVTPFSSFIVLTTPEQRAQLNQAALQDGRYVVNYDLGEEQLIEPTTGGLLGTSAVPEPHEWILLFTGFGVVLLFGRHKVQSLLTHHDS
ncbi:hypothetical protein KA012_03040 [Candidatus Woesebacteria bacterium]|nr:hypothetical protein [Candidatus Woesebacteria bacterium]